MGVSTSSLEAGVLPRWSAKEVAQFVSELGSDYEPAAKAVIENDFDGKVVAALADDVEMTKIVLDILELPDDAHRLTVKNKFSTLAKIPETNINQWSFSGSEYQNENPEDLVSLPVSMDDSLSSLKELERPAYTLTALASALVLALNGASNIQSGAQNTLSGNGTGDSGESKWLDEVQELAKEGLKSREALCEANVCPALCSTLKRHINNHILAEKVLSAIATLCTGCRTARASFFSADAPTLVVRALASGIRDVPPSLQNMGCFAISALCRDGLEGKYNLDSAWPQSAQAAVKAGGLNVVMKSIELFSSEQNPIRLSMALNAGSALALFANAEENRYLVKYAKQSMSMFIGDPSVLTYACACVALVPAAEEAVEGVIGAITRLSSIKSVQEQGFKALLNISMTGESGVLETIMNHGGCETICTALRKYSRHVTILTPALATSVAILKGNPETANRFIEQNLPSKTALAIIQHIDCTPLRIHGCEVISILAPLMSPEINLNILNAVGAALLASNTGGKEAVLRAVAAVAQGGANHCAVLTAGKVCEGAAMSLSSGETLETRLQACAAIAQLAFGSSECRVRLMEAGACEGLPGALRAALEVTENSVESPNAVAFTMIQQGLLAITCLARDRKEARTRLGTAGAIEVALKVLQCDKSAEQGLVEPSLLALTGLATDEEENSKVLSSAGGIEAATKIMSTQFEKGSETILAAAFECAAISVQEKTTDVQNSNRSKLLVEKLVNASISCTLSLQHLSALQRRMCMLFQVISNKGYGDVLISAGGLRVVLRAMEAHPSNAGVQFQSLGALDSICSAIDQNILEQNLAPVVKKAVNLLCGTGAAPRYRLETLKRAACIGEVLVNFCNKDSVAETEALLTTTLVRLTEDSTKSDASATLKTCSALGKIYQKYGAEVCILDARARGAAAKALVQAADSHWRDTPLQQTVASSLWGVFRGMKKEAGWISSELGDETSCETITNMLETLSWNSALASSQDAMPNAGLLEKNAPILSLVGLLASTGEVEFRAALGDAGGCEALCRAASALLSDKKNDSEDLAWDITEIICSLTRGVPENGQKMCKCGGAEILARGLYSKMIGCSDDPLELKGVGGEILLALGSGVEHTAIAEALLRNRWKASNAFISSGWCIAVVLVCTDTEQGLALGKSGVPEAVVKATQEAPNNLTLSAAACSATSALAAHCELNCTRLCESKVCSFLATAIRRILALNFQEQNKVGMPNGNSDSLNEGCNDNEAFLLAALEAVAYLSKQESGREEMSKVSMLFLLSELLNLYTTQICKLTKLKAIVFCLRSIAHLVEDPMCCRPLQEAKVHTSIVKILNMSGGGKAPSRKAQLPLKCNENMQLEAELGVAIAACRALSALASASLELRNMAGSAGACAALVSCQQHFPDDPELQVEALECAASLARAHIQNQKMLIDAGVCKTCISALNACASNASVCEKALWLAKAVVMDAPERIEVFVSAGFSRAVLNTIAAHPLNEDVQTAAMVTWAILSAAKTSSLVAPRGELEVAAERATRLWPTNGRLQRAVGALFGAR